MCGINGFNFSDEKLILEMNRLTSHRGPDETGFWLGKNISFGHNRLAIIDLSERGHQPMWDEQKSVAIIFNGEIYNFKELRAELETKYQFYSESDTEVIIYAYKEWGIECLKKLNGVFALAIWDTRTNDLWLARDRAGVNPLYYYADNQRFIFSSEIKAILAHNIPRQVDLVAFNLYFQLLYTPEPYTMFAGIKKLPAASYLHWNHNKFSIHKYWQVEDFSDLPSKVEAVTDVRAIFRDSVKHQLISDRPVGIFLSGGIDSTAVLGAANEFHDGQIKTFSVGFKDSLDPSKFNADFSLAKLTAKFYGTDHHELLIGASDVLDNLEKISWHLDEPNSNPTAGALFLLSQVAKPEVAVVLGGDGGDELFGGYPRYYYSALISQVQRFVPKFFSTLVSSKFNLPENERRITAFLSQKSDLLSQVIQPNILQPSEADDYLKAKYFDGQTLPINDFTKWFMQVDRQSWLVDESLLRTNKMSMAWGLESRVPILDYRLIELASRIPTRWKFGILGNSGKSFQGKNIWREAVRDYLPPHILNQQKRGWFTPMAKWLRQEPMRAWVEDLLSTLPAEFFNASTMQQIWADHLTGRVYNLQIIWAVVMWQLWYNKFIKS
ncbi:MAG: asparagine synthase (glutamine-hydrolyzing) [bacterium]|nr:asparagine synthase (glutamine-hydrolyzing) [bacterium]